MKVSEMSYNEMRRELKSRGLTCRGKKVELIKRLEEAMATTTATTASTTKKTTSSPEQVKEDTMSVTTILFDPSVIFLGSCLVAPLAVEFLENNLNVEVVVNYVFHEVPLVAMGLLIMFIAIAHRKGASFKSCTDRRVALWYLVNGIGFKSVMDTFSGTAQSWDLMTKQYNALESRYALSFSDNPVSVPVHLTSLLEISVMAPLCFWVYYLIVRDGRSSTRYVVELVLATLQIVGTYYFYAPLLFTSAGDRARGFLVSNNPLDFYLRGVFGSVICPLLWIIVPLIRIKSVTREMPIE